ncbi:MAG: hypothetical protein ACE366_13355 [Bradymonadia bacterium]
MDRYTLCLAVLCSALGCQSVEEADEHDAGAQNPGADAAVGEGGGGEGGARNAGPGGGGGAGGEAGNGGFSGLGGGTGEGCPNPGQMTLSLIDPTPEAPLTRADWITAAFEIDGGAPPITYTAQGDPGGLIDIDVEGMALRWAPGRNEGEAVPSPWWTGPVSITLRARDALGCTADSTISVELGGDVIISDGSDGRLFLFGGDGQFLGFGPQPAQGRGISLLLPLPRNVDGGGLIALMAPDGDTPAQMRRLDLAGMATGVDFETQDPSGTPLYGRGKMPRSIFYHPSLGEVLADDAVDSKIHRWRLSDGRYMGAWEVPYDGQGPSEVLGFAWLDDALVVGHEQHNRLYRIDDAGQPTEIGPVGDGIDDMFMVRSAASGDQVFTVMRRGQEFAAYAYDDTGRQLSSAQLFLYRPHQITRFFDGYLSTYPYNIETRLHLGDLSFEGVDRWHQQGEYEWRSPSGIVWLD